VHFFASHGTSKMTIISFYTRTRF